MNKKIESWWKVAQQKEKTYYGKLYDGLNLKIEEPILEIGGGAGTFLSYMGIKKATIIDLGGKKSLVGNFKFICADITKKLPKMRKKFRTILVMETLEHIKNPLYLMAQVYDLLEKEGICYISIPYTKLDINRKNEENPYNCHVCRWNKKEIINQMEKLGFNTTIILEKRSFSNSLRGLVRKFSFWRPPCWLVLKLEKRFAN